LMMVGQATERDFAQTGINSRRIIEATGNRMSKNESLSPHKSMNSSADSLRSS